MILENGAVKTLNLGIIQTTAQRLLFQSSVSRSQRGPRGKLYTCVKYGHIWFECWGASSRMRMCVIGLCPGKIFEFFVISPKIAVNRALTAIFRKSKIGHNFGPIKPFSNLIEADDRASQRTPKALWTAFEGGRNVVWIFRIEEILK